MTKKTKNKYNHYTEDFRREAVRRSDLPGASAVEVVHSDRGVQYRSSEYQYLLLSKGIRPSMSRKGNCWDNAAMETFFSRLKVESVYADQPTTKQEAYSLVFEYIELFYNRVRRHSAIGYKSPAEYE